MPKTKVVKAGGMVVRYSSLTPKRIAGDHLRLPNYRQEDGFSCGFVAALTVARFFYPDVFATDVLRAVCPGVNTGASNTRLIRGLKKLGVEATYREPLTVGDLRRYVKRGTPVIVGVCPDDWPGDHWAVVQGFAGDRIYLVNHWGMTVDSFSREWTLNYGAGSRGAGLVCRESK